MPTVPPSQGHPDGSDRNQGPAGELSPGFQSAFIALRYVLGTRGEALAEELAPLHASAQHTVRRLTQPDRQHRAQALALELAKVIAELDRRVLR